MQAKSAAATFSERRRPKQPASLAQRLDCLALQRDQRLAQIAALRETKQSKFLDNACRLLSGRFWSRAPAQSREQLLQTVNVMMLLAQRAETLATAGPKALRPSPSAPTGPAIPGTQAATARITVPRSLR